MAEYPAVNSTSAPEEPEIKDNPQEEQKETEDEIVKRIQKLKDTYEQASKESRKEIGEIYSSYMGKMDEVQATPYDTKDSIPKLRTEIAYIKPFIFSGEPVVEVEGVGDEDKTISKIYEKIINHRFQTIPNFNEKIEAWVGQGVGFGTSIIKVLWRFTTKKNEDGTETPIKDEPDIEVPNILDVYYNPIISELDDQPCVIFRAVLPAEAVKSNPIYDYVNENGIRNADEVGGGVNFSNTFNSSVLMKTDIPSAQQKATEGMVEIYELIDNDKIQTIGNGKLLRDTPNAYGFKNAVKFIFEPNIIPNRMDGLGVGQNTHGLGKMFYKFFNQASMNVKMVNNPMFAVEKGTNIDKRQAVSKPGGVIEVDTKGQPLNNVFQVIQYDDLKTGFMEMLNKVDDEHKRASGANDLLQGSASNDTLGQDQISQANISNRFELIVRRFKGALSEVAKMILKMELQNLQSPDAEILRIFPGPQPVTDKMGLPVVDPMTGQPQMQNMREQIYQILINERDNVKYNIKIKGETNVARNKALESKRLVEMFNIATAVQTAQGPLLANEEMRSFLRKILELNGQQNVDELIAEQAPQPALQPPSQIDPNTGQPAEMPRSMPNMPQANVVTQ